MTDFYGILGVERDASPEDLHAAYRRLAKIHHPDAGGNPAVFNAIAQAFAILRDPDKRTAYDHDGTIDTKADNSHRDALAIVHGEIDGLLGAIANQGEIGVIHSDVIVVITGVIDEKIKRIEEAAEGIRRNVIRFSNFADRFTAKSGTSVIRSMIEAKIRNLEEALPKAEADLTAHRKAREIVNNEQFRVDQMVHQPGVFRIFGG